MQILRGRPHRHRRWIDEPLRDEARVEVHLVGHRMVAHVLDTAREHDVRSPERDLPRAGGHGCQSAGAHPVEREARNGLRNPCEQRDVASERESLIANLCGRSEDDVTDPLERDLRIAPHELAHDLDRHVVRARLPEHALRAGAAECRAHAVDEHHLAQAPCHADESTRRLLASLRAAHAAPRAPSSSQRAPRGGTGSRRRRPV